MKDSQKQLANKQLVAKALTEKIKDITQKSPLQVQGSKELFQILKDIIDITKEIYGTIIKIIRAVSDGGTFSVQQRIAGSFEDTAALFPLCKWVLFHKNL